MEKTHLIGPYCRLMYPEEIVENNFDSPYFLCHERLSPIYDQAGFKEYVYVARSVIRKTKSAKRSLN